MYRYTDAEIETLEAFVEAVLERVADGTDDVETAKTDLMTVINVRSREAAREAVSSAANMLRMWRGANA